MRLFVSIELPAGIRQKLHASMPGLKGWRKSEVEKFHLTLLFIGACTVEEMEEIADKLNQVSFKAFDMRITRYGAFYHRGEPAVIWRQAEGNGSLYRLREHIVRAAGPYVKGRIREKFHPHITLARRKKREKPDLYELDKLLNETPEPLSFTSGSFSLMQSRLSSEGSRYKMIREFTSNEIHGL